LTSIWRLSHPDSRSPDDPDDSESEYLTSGSSDDGESVSEDHDLSDRSIGSDDESEGETKELKGVPDSQSDEKRGDDGDAAVVSGDTGPESHEKTECSCGKDGHYEKVVCDEVVKASLGKVWTCVFGESKDFMMHFLRDSQKLQGGVTLEYKY
jgi:hypothetical protein